MHIWQALRPRKMGRTKGSGDSEKEEARRESEGKRGRNLESIR